jgi:hypothetical protein
MEQGITTHKLLAQCFFCKQFRVFADKAESMVNSANENSQSLNCQDFAGKVALLRLDLFAL